VQLSGISNSYGSSGVERALASLVSQTSGGSRKAGQVLPGADQDGDRGGPPPPPPPRSTGQASSQFAANTLASLLSLQQQPSASDFASKLIGQVDADGDGSLSLDEIRSTLEKAGLTKASAAAPGEDFMSSAFGKLDGNRDGKLDTTELTSALEEMMKSHHGHRHGPPPAPPQDLASASGGAATASTAVETVSATSVS